MEEPSSLEHAYARLAWLVPHLPVEVLALHPPRMREGERTLELVVSPVPSDVRRRLERMLTDAAVAGVTDLRETEGGWFAYAWSDDQRIEAGRHLTDFEKELLDDLAE